jgi:hypothetical protein
VTTAVLNHNNFRTVRATSSEQCHLKILFKFNLYLFSHVNFERFISTYFQSTFSILNYKDRNKNLIFKWTELEGVL